MPSLLNFSLSSYYSKAKNYLCKQYDSLRGVSDMQSEFEVYIYEEEYRQIQQWVLVKSDIETGGDLFGLWVEPRKAVVQFVLGPGQQCRRNKVSFYQDVDYLSDIGKYLLENHGLCNIGQWHSHHRLQLDEPSTGDRRTVWQNLPLLNLDSYLMFIATIRDGSRGQPPNANVSCFLFKLDAITRQQLPVSKGQLKFLSGNSPMRLHREIFIHSLKGAESVNKVSVTADEKDTLDKQNAICGFDDESESNLATRFNPHGNKVDESGAYWTEMKNMDILTQMSNVCTEAREGNMIVSQANNDMSLKSGIDENSPESSYPGQDTRQKAPGKISVLERKGETDDNKSKGTPNKILATAQYQYRFKEKGEFEIEEMESAVKKREIERKNERDVKDMSYLNEVSEGCNGALAENTNVSKPNNDVLVKSGNDENGPDRSYPGQGTPQKALDKIIVLERENATDNNKSKGAKNEMPATADSLDETTEEKEEFENEEMGSAVKKRAIERNKEYKVVDQENNETDSCESESSSSSESGSDNREGIKSGCDDLEVSKSNQKGGDSKFIKNEVIEEVTVYMYCYSRTRMRKLKEKSERSLQDGPRSKDDDYADFPRNINVNKTNVADVPERAETEFDKNGDTRIIEKDGEANWVDGTANQNKGQDESKNINVNVAGTIESKGAGATDMLTNENMNGEN